MADKSLAPDISVRISKIQLVSFNVEKDVKIKSEEIGNLAYEQQMKVKIHSESNTISFNLEVRIFQDESRGKLYGTMSSFAEFEMLQMNEVLKYFKGGVPTEILVNLAGIVVSTSRGFLSLSAVNTPLAGAIIPMMDPNTFFPKKDIVKG